MLAVLVAGATVTALAAVWTGTAPWQAAVRHPDAGPSLPAPVPGPAGTGVAATGVDGTGVDGSVSAPSGTGTPTGAASLVTATVAPGAEDTAVAHPTAATDWVVAVSDATGIPAVAMQAYADATLAVAATQPGCHLGWSTLAAIGGIESGHGTHAGSALQADGHPEPPVIGPPLDGTPGTRAMRATAAGTAEHGDPVWEHAVGPMQFLPDTWRRWGADGDRDGTADPHDIADAALAAARYLCAGGARDLSTGEGWWSAVRSYNHDDAYVARVLQLADAYTDAAQQVP
ncbi:lytic murein transglycosylase [Cellulomonas soli]